MGNLSTLFCFDVKRRSKDGFFIGYNIIFPIIMILLLGLLSQSSYNKGFTGFHYYTVVTIPFCTAMGLITAAYAGKDDAYKKTAVRLLFSPVSKKDIVLSRLLSCLVIMSLCNLFVLLFAKLVLGFPIYWNIIPVFLILSSLSLLVCAIGLFIGLGMKNFILIKNVMNIPLSLFGILSGAFFPIGTLNPLLNAILYISPLTWVNRSIFLYIYDGNPTLLWVTTPVLTAAGLLFSIFAVKSFKKEEYIHGELPGYEK